MKSAETQFQEEKLRIQRQHEDSLKHVRLSTYSPFILQYTIVHHHMSILYSQNFTITITVVHHHTSVYPDFPFWILSCSFFFFFSEFFQCTDNPSRCLIMKSRTEILSLGLVSVYHSISLYTRVLIMICVV